MDSSTRLPLSLFTTDGLDPDDCWTVWRESISVIFDVRPDDAQAVPLQAAVQAYHLGALVFGDTRFTPQYFGRSTRKIARDGLDHYLVQIYFDGGFAGQVGAHDAQLRAGDLCILDLSQPLDTRNPASHNRSMVIPRDMLDAVLPDAPALHGITLRRETALAKLLTEHLLALGRRMPELTAADALPVANATVGLIAACFQPSAEAMARARPHIDAARVEGIKRHVEQHLAAPGLTPEAICGAFGMSRATLYRLFEPYGGIAAYIRGRRLAHAYAELLRPRSARRRICDIALDWGFADEAQFCRSFRRQFDMTPSEARALAEGQGGAAFAHRMANGSDYTGWLTTLTPGMSDARSQSHKPPEP
jgi:AraC-like DNA-binding protein